MLLALFTIAETLRALLAFAVIDCGVRISPTFISFCSEILKLVITAVFLFRHVSQKYGSISRANLLAAIYSPITNYPSVKPWKALVAFALPSALYLVNNILYLLGLCLTSPALLYIAILAKLPITAVLHHFLVRCQRQRRAWLSLLVLSLGLIIPQVPSIVAYVPVLRGTVDVEPFPPASGTLSGFAVGTLVAVISGFSSTYTEILFKYDVEFWVAQFWLYGFGTLFAAITFFFWDGSISNTSLEPASNPLATEPTKLMAITGTVAVILSTAATGFVVATILRKKDNLVKPVGTPAGIVALAIAQCLLFPRLREKTLNTATILGIVTISISTWTYNHYKDSPINLPSSSLDLDSLGGSDQEEDWAPEFGRGRNSKQPSFSTPTLKRILLVTAFTLTLTWITKLNMRYVPAGNSYSDFQNPINQTPFNRSHRSLLTTTPTGVDDVERFFVPHSIVPASWGQSADNEIINSSLTCITEWLDRDHVSPISTKFTDWEYAYLESRCPVYPIPRGGLLFHQYWSGNWRPFNEVNIEAWLATQRLGDGHRLIYWFDNGEVPNSVLRKFATGQFADYVEFRKLNRTEEARGTCVANMPEWTSEEYRVANSMKLESLADITRNLLLAKYGGVWIDSDTIPMRDLTPLIRSGPSAGGISGGDWNNNLLVFGPPNTTVTQRVLETTCSLSINKTIYNERYGHIKPHAWYWMWNDALFKICASQTHCGFSRIPIYFNDGWTWLGEGQRALRPCEPQQQWFGSGNQLPVTLRTLWSWHPRLGQYSDSCVDRTGKTIIGAVRRRIDELLHHGLDMNGRDLFPGPSVTS
ncbi:nucleotide-sugar transporter-domain-containing protein [Phaeosphaeriaceae sp. PMI808]|nr:nucleotide-sugar transporter-domain-containing protein [Phaeosphaeriaceae sp. PMI808]